MKEIIKFKHIASNKCNRSLRIMKISILLFILCIFSIQAENVYSQQKELSLNLKNVTITKAISEIEKASDYVFLIADEAQLELKKKTSIRASKESIHAILETLLNGTDLGYSVVERQVSLYKSMEPKTAEKPATVIEAIEQQKKQIVGNVKDNNGLSIIGANIVEAGTTNGTVTDMDGNFTLSVEEDAVLHISYIGYFTQEINTAGKSNITITLLEDTQSLEELVVIGYGSMTRKDVTSSITTVNAEKLNVGGLY